MCQKTPSLPALLGRGVPQLLHPREGVVDAEVLVVAGEQLDEPAGPVLERDEVLDQVEQALLRAHAPDHRLQRDDPSSPSELIFFHSEKNSQPEVIVPTLVSAPLERTRKPFGVKRCGMASR